MNVLVVDDSAAMRKIVVNALSKTMLKGAKIVEAANGKEGIDKFFEGDFRLILSDWNMPEIDGLAFVQRIRQSDNAVKIIMITAEGTTGKLDEACEAGVDDYIVKPFTPEILDRKIKRVFARGK